MKGPCSECTLVTCDYRPWHSDEQDTGGKEKEKEGQTWQHDDWSAVSDTGKVAEAGTLHSIPRVSERETVLEFPPVLGTSHQHVLLAQILEAELQAQAVVLETLNTNLYHCQLELQREVRPGWREGGAAEEAQTAGCPVPPKSLDFPTGSGEDGYSNLSSRKR